MKKYNKPIMKITTYATIDTTNLNDETSYVNAVAYNETDKIDTGTFTLNDLNN